MSRTVDEPGYQADVQGNMIEQHERRLRELEERARVQANLDEQTLLRAMQAALPEYKAAFSENYGPHWAAMVTRVEALERRYSPDAQEQDHAWARKVDEKLEELERDMSTIVELERRLQTLDALRHEMRRTVDEHTMQLRALEAGHQQDGATQDNILTAHEGLLKRIEALERGDMLVSQSRDERDRQARWHDTYNATWPALASRYQPYQLIFADRNANPIGDCDKHDEEVRGRLDWLHMAASNIADRAHGPLDKEKQRAELLDEVSR